jgi:20S proteasome alpha/beta subunit
VVSAGIGEGVSAIKGEYKGRLEDLLGRLLVAGVSAAAEDKATSAVTPVRLSAIAKMVAAIGDDMPKVQQFLEAQVKYLEAEDRAKLRVMILTEVMRNEPDMSQSKTPNQADSHYESHR